MPTGDYTDKWRTKTFSYSLSSWDQILQQRWVGRFCHQRDSCHELSAVLATLTNCEENIEEKCGLPLTRKITNNLILRHGNLFPGIGPIATKLRRAARLQLNSYQVGFDLSYVLAMKNVILMSTWSLPTCRLSSYNPPSEFDSCTTKDKTKAEGCKCVDSISAKYIEIIMVTATIDLIYLNCA